MAIRDLIVTMIVVGSLPFVLLRPYIGIYMWAWLSYMNPHRLTWGFAYDFPFAQLVAATLLVGLLFTKDRKAIPLNSLTTIWVLLIGWMCITTLFSLNPDYAWVGWDRSMKIQLLALITLVLIFKKETIHGFAWIVCLSIVFFGTKGGIFILLHGGHGKVYGPLDSFFEDNNALAVTLLMVLPLLVYLIRTVKDKVHFGPVAVSASIVRLGLWACVGLSVISVFFTHSRGAFLTGAAMTGLALVRLKQRAVLITILVIAIPVGLSFLPDEWFERMQTIKTYQEDTSATGRINAWLFAINLANERPLLGGGFDTFTPELFKKYAPNPDHFQDSHSIYFEMLGEHGYVGLGLFLMVGFLTYMMAGRLNTKKAQSHPALKNDQWIGDMAVALQFGIVAYAVGGAFLGLAYFDLYYHIVGMVLILNRYAEGLKGDQMARSNSRGRTGEPARETSGMHVTGAQDVSVNSER